MLYEILKKINDKGWNLYKIKDDETLNTAVSRGKVDKFTEYGHKYLLLPRVELHKSLDSIKEKMAYVERNKLHPIISYGYIPIALALFTINKNDIKITERTDIKLSYKNFFESLETLTDININ